MMECRVSSNCTRNIHRPSTPVKKRSTEKKTQRERLPIGNSKVYACLDIDFSEVLCHYVMFNGKEIRDVSTKIFRLSFDGIS